MSALIFNESCKPDLGTDELLELHFQQTLSDDSARAEAEGTLYVKAVGPRLRLDPSEIAGCSPSPGSTTSPDEFLPHIALRRRTLPWERLGPIERHDLSWVPWMMLLVLSDAERTQWKLGEGPLEKLTGVEPILKALYTDEDPQQTVRWLKIKESLFRPLMPPTEQLPLFSGLLRLPPDDTQGLDDEDGDLALVIGSRLPDAGPENEPTPLHTALLLSLEGRADLLSAGGEAHRLIVLHHWTFTPSKQGDFEYVMKAMRYAPQGGVLRFGMQPAEPGRGPQALLTQDGSLLIPDESDQEVKYRGPLRGVPVPTRKPTLALRADPTELDPAVHGAQMDLSEACAFELGRLSMLSDPGALAALDEVRRVLAPDLNLVNLSDQAPALLAWRNQTSRARWLDAQDQPLLKIEVPVVNPSGRVVLPLALPTALKGVSVRSSATQAIDLSKTDALSQLNQSLSGLRQRS